MYVQNTLPFEYYPLEKHKCCTEALLFMFHTEARKGKKICHLLESNQRPSLYESDALPLSQGGTHVGDRSIVYSHLLDGRLEGSHADSERFQDSHAPAPVEHDAEGHGQREES